jgi:hypothetical protein
VDQVHDEIQVYNAEINEIGQWSYEQHLNFAPIGQTKPEFPGGFTSNHSLQGTPEFAYGLTNWWEVGFYLPFAVGGTGEFPMGPRFGVFSSAQMPKNATSSMASILSLATSCRQSPWGLEIRRIIGVRNNEWEFIVNPIVDVSFGPGGEADFLPAARLARNLGEDRFIGLEYYSDYGKIGNILPLQQQYQELYAVTDFKVKDVDVELGAGYGFTPGSDRLIFKAILGYAFPVPGKNKDESSGSNSSMTMGTQPRLQNPFLVK